MAFPYYNKPDGSTMYGVSKSIVIALYSKWSWYLVLVSGICKWYSIDTLRSYNPTILSYEPVHPYSATRRPPIKAAEWWRALVAWIAFLRLKKTAAPPPSVCCLEDTRKAGGHVAGTSEGAQTQQKTWWWCAQNRTTECAQCFTKTGPTSNSQSRPPPAWLYVNE